MTFILVLNENTVARFLFEVFQIEPSEIVQMEGVESDDPSESKENNVKEERETVTMVAE